MLRRTTVRPGGSAPTAADAVYYANRLTTLSHELVRSGKQFGLLTVCAAGALGHAMVLERT